MLCVLLHPLRDSDCRLPTLMLGYWGGGFFLSQLAKGSYVNAQQLWLSFFKLR